MSITHTPRQRPVAAALDQLLADAEARAAAIEDNARDDGVPVDAIAVHNWCLRLNRIAAALHTASDKRAITASFASIQAKTPFTFPGEEPA